MKASRRSRDAEKASSAFEIWWKGTSAENEFAGKVARKHLAAARAHLDEGNNAKAAAHIAIAEGLVGKIEKLDIGHLQ